MRPLIAEFITRGSINTQNTADFFVCFSLDLKSISHLVINTNEDYSVALNYTIDGTFHEIPCHEHFVHALLQAINHYDLLGSSDYQLLVNEDKYRYGLCGKNIFNAFVTLFHCLQYPSTLSFNILDIYLKPDEPSFINHKPSQLTFKSRNEFGDERHWEKLSTLEGCDAIITATINNLVEMKPFNGVENKECIDLANFEHNVKKRLKLLLSSDNYNPDEINDMFIEEVNKLVLTLKSQEFKNRVHSLLMAACGFILGALAVAPLGLPLYSSSVRDYVYSFFSPPKMTAQIFQTQVERAIEELKKLTTNQEQCLFDKDNHEYCLESVVKPASL